MIITGAPVENLEYEDVDYWGELTRIMDWSKTHVTSTLHICWAALAGLYYHYGVPKHPLKEKCSGVFKHKVNRRTAKLVRGFDNEFYAPHSRFQEVRAEDIKKVKELEILCDSKRGGRVYRIYKRRQTAYFCNRSRRIRRKQRCVMNISDLEKVKIR